MVFPALDYTHGSIFPKQKNERILVIFYKNTTAVSANVSVQDATDISAVTIAVPLEREAAVIAELMKNPAFTCVKFVKKTNCELTEVEICVTKEFIANKCITMKRKPGIKAAKKALSLLSSEQLASKKSSRIKKRVQAEAYSLIMNSLLKS